MPGYITPEECNARGEAIYKTVAGPLEAEHYGRVIVIDVVSGDYEIADTDREATQAIRERRPDAPTWGRCIGGDGAIDYGSSVVAAWGVRSSLRGGGALGSGEKGKRRREEKGASERGKAIYRELSSQLEVEHRGKVVVIDVVSGDYEIGEDASRVALRLLEKRPGAITWGCSIGGDGGGGQFCAVLNLEYL